MYARCTAARTRRNLTQMSVATRSRSHSRGLVSSWTPAPVYSSSTRCSTPLCSISVSPPPRPPIFMISSTAVPANDLHTELPMQKKCIDDEGIGHSRPSRAPLQRCHHALRWHRYYSSPRLPLARTGKQADPSSRPTQYSERWQ